MKYRVLDFLQCRCGNGKFKVATATIKKVPFKDQFTKVCCKNICSFKDSNIEGGNVTPRDCVECYGLEVVEGRITCSCGRGFSVVRGIPRFLENDLDRAINKTQKAFSWEWKMFLFGERNWGQTLSERRELFNKGMGTDPDELKGKLILDAGCGSGALSIDMSKSLGMEVVAMDLALGIERAYQYNDSPYVYFIQGSVLKPPLREQSFDYLYAAGVLHHTNPDTLKAFRAIIPTLKKGGRCFTWVYNSIDKKYHPHDRLKLLFYDFVRRKITSRLPIQVQFFLYLSLIPAFLFKQGISCLLGRKRYRLSWREKMQDFFDGFSPVYSNKHTHEEVIGWFESEGFINVEISIIEHLGFGTRGDLAKMASE